MNVLLALAAQQHGVVTTAEAESNGVTKKMRRAAVKKGVLCRRGPKVYVVAGAPQTWHQDLLVAVRAAGDGAVACLTAAATLHGIRTGTHQRTEVLVTGLRRGGTQAEDVHRTDYLPAHHVVVIDGIPCTAPARTVMDLIGRKPFVKSPERARRLVKNALMAGVAAREMRKVVAECSVQGRNGCGVLRDILEEINPSYVPTESELEDLLLAVLEAAGLPLPKRQAVIGGTRAPVGRFDFYDPDVKLVLEADSEKFHAGWVQQERDRERDFKLKALGITVLRPTWRLLTREPQTVVAAVRAHYLLAKQPG